MNHPRNDEEDIFDAALKFATKAERTAYVDGACAGDDDLRQRVEGLLAAHVLTTNVLDRPPLARAQSILAAASASPVMEEPGQHIGRYKLREKIGEGGCGVVYVADQEEPVRRRVALKIVKLGMDTRQVVARFEAERQVLALMDHPNIAKVLDGGATETGRPYFVMELVRGIKITDYCDQNNLPTEDRLKLFIQVCKAVQHAHQKGIIHRDIKPSNVLVTVHDGVPVPKVIDFGIAKATSEQRLTDKTIYTAFEQFLGTPAYMSPEQAEMSELDIDTRSDIYSLGVLLYELLTGKTPFDPGTLLRGGIEQMRRIIREEEPSRPSACLTTLAAADLSTVAAHRHAEPPKLIHAIRGDLDWIVMKLLEKDRTRRYETADGVAADIQRHLKNEPVLARPPGQFYRFQKLVRRHKLPVVSACLILLLLVLGVTGTTIGFLRSEHQRRTVEMAQKQSRENFDQARATVSDMLAISDDDLYDLPGVQSVRVKLMRAALDRYKPFLEKPLEDPAPLAELGRLYLKYGFAAAEIGEDTNTVVLPAYQAAFAIQKELVKKHPKNPSFCADLGWTLIYWKLWGNQRGVDKEDEKLARQLFESLLKENPQDPFARSGLVWSLGLTEAWNPLDEEYFSASEKRRTILEELVKEFPHSAEFRRDLANQWMWYPYNTDGVYNFTDHLARLVHANELRAAVVADMERHDPAIWLPLRPRDSEALLLKPSLVWAKRDLARGWFWAALEYQSVEQWPSAISLSERSTALYRELVEQNPTIIKFASELRYAFDKETHILESSGNTNRAKALRQEAVEFWQKHPPAEPAAGK